MTERILAVGKTVYYKTRNNRAGRGVIKSIAGGCAVLEYRIQTRQISQVREVVRSVNELFATAEECEAFINSGSGMGVPTEKVYNQFYWIKVPQGNP